MHKTYPKKEKIVQTFFPVIEEGISLECTILSHIVITLRQQCKKCKPPVKSKKQKKSKPESRKLGRLLTIAS